MKKKQKQPASKFRQALTITLSADGWVLPESHALDVLDAHIRRLEQELETLTGGRSAGPKRIDPLDKPLPS